MTKERVWIFAIVFAFTIGMIVLWRYHIGKGFTCTSPKDVTETESVEETEALDAGPITAESIAYFKNAKYLTVEKVERTIVEEDNGVFETSYDSYVMSDVNLNKKSDQTLEYALALSGMELDEEKIQTLEFQDAFAFEYSDMNGWEIYEALLSAYGIDGSIKKATFDDVIHEQTGQNMYVLDDSCSIWKSNLMNVTSDEVIEQKVSFQMIETNDGTMVPDCFNATMTYRVGSQTITKSLYLQVAVNNWSTGEEE